MHTSLSEPNHRRRISAASVKSILGLFAAGLTMVGPAGLVTVRADMVTDWNFNFQRAAKAAAQLPPVEARCASIVQAAVFDAVNGIDHEYEPYLVSERAPNGA